MKKLISLLLAVVLAASLCTVAFAADISENEGSASADVTASYVAGDAPAIVYEVDVAWTAMEFTYRGVSAPVWDAENHEYTGSFSAAGWDETDDRITVTNYSSTSIQVEPSYAPASGYNGVDMVFGAEALRLDSPATDGGTTAGEITVTPDGVLSSSATTATTIGTVTVTIRKAMDGAEEELRAMYQAVYKAYQDAGYVIGDSGDAAYDALEVGDAYVSAMEMTATGNTFDGLQEMVDAGTYEYSELYSQYMDAYNEIYKDHLRIKK